MLYFKQPDKSWDLSLNSQSHCLNLIVAFLYSSNSFTISGETGYAVGWLKVPAVISDVRLFHAGGRNPEGCHRSWWLDLRDTSDSWPDFAEIGACSGSRRSSRRPRRRRNETWRWKRRVASHKCRYWYTAFVRDIMRHLWHCYLVWKLNNR